MPPKAPQPDLPIHPFTSVADFESFLDDNHTTLPAFYLKVARRSTGIPSITAADATTTALCFGWIDGTGHSLDEHWYLVRFTPRRPRSLWSAKNVASAERLLAEGRVRPAGVAAIEAAKADGRWERAYAGPATIEAPQDFEDALKEDEAAEAFFRGLKRMQRYAVLLRVQTASPTNRAHRIEGLVRMLAEGKCPSAGGKSTAKSEKSTRVDKTASQKATTEQSSSRRQRQRPLPVQDDQATQPRRAGLRPRH